MLLNPDEHYVNVRIPGKFLEKMSVDSGSEIEVRLIDDHIELHSIKENLKEDKTCDLMSILKNPPGGLTDLKEYELRGY